MADPRFEQALYEVPEAARLARVPARSLWNWVRGYRYPTQRGLARAKPVIKTTADGKALSFINLSEVVALVGFRHAGVSMQGVRKALDYVGREMNEQHPLATKRILTDGAELFWEYQHRRDSEFHLVNLSRGGQKVFRDTVLRYLRQIEWGPDRYAIRWWPGSNEAGKGDVVVDPRRAFGAPVLAGTGIRTEDVFDRFSAGEGLRLLARDYGLTIGQIEAAVRAEARFLEPIAA